MLVAYKADPIQAHSIALTTSKGPVGVWVEWSRGGPGLFPLSFSFQSFTTGGFKVTGIGLDSAASMVLWFGCTW